MIIKGQRAEPLGQMVEAPQFRQDRGQAFGGKLIAAGARQHLELFQRGGLPAAAFSHATGLPALMAAMTVP